MALWTPANLTSVLLVGWYRLRDPNGIIAQGADAFNGTDVTAWKDRSGLGNDLPRFPRNDASDMVYRADGFGAGIASIRTSGIYYGTGWTGPVAGIPSGKMGAFAALMTNSAQSTNGARILSTGNVPGGNAGNQDYSSPNAILIYEDGTAGTNLTTYFGPSAGMTVSPGVPMVVGTYHKGDNVQGLALDGVEKATLSRGYDTAPLNLGIGTNGAYKGAYWLGDHAEYVLFMGTLSLTEQQQLSGYMAWNNGTQGSLPANHPYKAAAPTIAGGDTGTPPGGGTIILPRRRRLILLSA
jgi:hypothetical protein